MAQQTTEFIRSVLIRRSELYTIGSVQIFAAAVTQMVLRYFCAVWCDVLVPTFRRYILCQ